jgi:hypothetical protein
MNEDIVIEEIRKVRHIISKQFNNNTRSILDHYKELESKYGDRILKEDSSQSQGVRKESNC